MVYVRREGKKQKQKAKIMLSRSNRLMEEGQISTLSDSRLIGKHQTKILLDLSWPSLPHQGMKVQKVRR
jgi:hypothetical protein